MQERGVQARPAALSASGILLLAVLLLSVSVPSAHAGSSLPFEAEDRDVYRVRVVTGIEGSERLSAAGYDVAGRDLRVGWVELITDSAGLQQLIDAGFQPEILSYRSRPEPLAQALGESETGRTPTSPLVDVAYTDNAEMLAFLQQVVADHSAITRLEQVGTSVHGREIWAMMISDHAALDEDELAVLFNSDHHPREVMTPEVIMDTIDYLTDNYGIDPAVTAAVDSLAIWCVPVVNPDGLDLVFNEDNYWRKNAADNDENDRITWKDGVDPNRNYEWGWGGQCKGSSSYTTAATYRGPAEATEPETRAMIELGRRIQPVIYVEYHSYGEDVFYAMGCDPGEFSPRLSTIVGPDQSISRVIGEDYASRIVQADGGLGFLAVPFGSRVDGIGRDHHAHESGAIAFVTELNSAAEGGFQPDYATWRDATVVGQRPGWLWLLERVFGPAVGGHVTDAVTAEPLLADIALDELIHPDGRRLTTRPGTGRFHVLVVPGSYTLRVNAPGYEEAVVPVTVGETWQPLQVPLTPLGSSRIVFEDFEDAARAAAWLPADPGDTATAGLWQWGEPEVTSSGNVLDADLTLGNPALDRSPGLGVKAFVTGNAPGAPLDEGDVDGGAATLTTPGYDLDGWYAVQASWQLWLRNEPVDPLDGLEVEVSGDGGIGWVSLGVWVDPTATLDAQNSWVRVGARLDDVLRPGSDVRIRFRASDTGEDGLVEVAIDDLELRGYSLTAQGIVSGLRFTGAGAVQVEWDPVPGAADAVYEVVRGDLDALAAAAGVVDLGELTCIDSAAPGTSLTLDSETPAPGTGWFYLARFELGFSTGEWGRGSGGEIRTGSGGCTP